MTKIESIAIDGPVASGKSTVGAALALRLGYIYFDTGVMYRAVTLAALRHGIPGDNEKAVARLAAAIQIDVLAPTAADGRQYTVLLDGDDVTWAIRSAEVDAEVSVVSAYAAVRQIMTAEQRQIGLRGKVVMVGRDIGTVVMPDAKLKVFLQASAEERARRRYREQVERGQQICYEDLLAAIVRRDHIDSAREVAPLQSAADAWVIKTDGVGIQAVVDLIEEKYRTLLALENEKRL